DYPTFLTWILCKKCNVPYVITLHGGLNDQWRTKQLHKRCYFNLFAKSILSNAAIIHTLNYKESSAVKTLGFPENVREIPNWVGNNIFALHSPEKHKSEVRNVIYLGRL